jgi:hypothetical protein
VDPAYRIATRSGVRTVPRQSLYDMVLAGFGPEDWEHKAVVEYCDARGIPVFHVPNSTFTKSRMVRLRNTILGVRAGIPDLCVVTPSGLLFIEMKKTGKSETTAYQKEWIERLNNTPGCEARVCKGAEVAIAFIEEFLPITRGHSPALPVRTTPKKQPKTADFDDNFTF